LAFLTAVLVLVCAGAASAQDHPREEPPDLPLTVETVGLEPTVAKTGDSITATFRVRFRDLVDEGKEIIVLEDRMAPDKLSVAPFEGTGLKVAKRQAGDQHIWDFVYTFRIVNPNKGIHVLGRVTFYWLIRDVGQNVEEARVLQSETDPLQLRYVTTLTEDATLNIRDSIELGNFASRARVLRAVAWTVAPLPLVLWAATFAMALRRRKPQGAAMRPRAEEDEHLEVAIEAPPTLGRARRTLLGELNTLGEAAPSEDARELLGLERRLVIALRDYLRAEVPGLHSGDTAREIKQFIDAGPMGEAHREILGALAGRLVAYQRDLERGTPSALGDPAAEAREVEALLRSFGPRARALARVRKAIGRA
jgi:hypothetical protein